MADVRENPSNFSRLDLHHRRMISEEDKDMNHYRDISHTEKEEINEVKRCDL